MKTSIHILLFSLGLQLSACGGGEDSNKNTPATTSTSATTTIQVPTAEQAPQPVDKVLENKQEDTVVHPPKMLLAPVAPAPTAPPTTEESSPPVDATMTRAQRDKEARHNMRNREQRAERTERKDKQAEND